MIPLQEMQNHMIMKIRVLFYLATMIMISCSNSDSPPQVKIILSMEDARIVEGQLLEGIISTMVTEGGVKNVKVYFDDDLVLTFDDPIQELPFQFEVKKPSGQHYLGAEAVDEQGHIGVDEIIVSVIGKNDYLKVWQGIYRGEVDVWSDGFAGSTSRIKDLEMIVSPSSSDSTLNFLIKINDEVIRQQALRVSGEGEHASSWGEVSNSGFLHLTFLNDTLQYRYQQSMGLGRRDGHDGVDYRQ